MFGLIGRYSLRRVPKSIGRLHYDCSGQVLNCQESVLPLVDETISNLITWEGRSSALITEALAKDTSSPMVLIAAAMESQRHGLINGPSTNELLEQLTKLAEKNQLSPREQYFAAAIDATHRSDFYRAGALYETALTLDPRDILALRMAHHSYIAAGRPRDAFGCTVRHRGVHAIIPTLAPCVQGMVAQGYLELDLIERSEETALRGINMSRRYSDIWSVQALLGAYHFCGKSSEAISAVTTNKLKDSRFGERMWTFGEGMSLIMRGSNIAAYKKCLEILQLEGIADSKVLQLDMALMMWYLVLHISSSHVIPLDTLVNLLHCDSVDDLESKPLSIDTLIIHTIKLALTVYYTESENIEGLLPFRKVQRSQNNVSEGFTAGKGKHSMGFLSFIVGKPQVNEEEHTNYAKFQEEKAEHVRKARQMLEQWIQRLKSLPEKMPLSTQSSSCLQKNVHPALPYMYSPSSELDQKQALDVCQAVALFALGDYRATCETLQPGYYRRYEGLGLSALHRDIFSTTFLEATVREGNVEAASRFLTERVMLYPNDGQTWLRLSRVYRQQNMLQVAEEAEYSAWQLGIGQGGFGGAM